MVFLRQCHAGDHFDLILPRASVLAFYCKGYIGKQRNTMGIWREVAGGNCRAIMSAELSNNISLCGPSNYRSAFILGVGQLLQVVRCRLPRNHRQDRGISDTYEGASRGDPPAPPRADLISPSSALGSAWAS